MSETITLAHSPDSDDAFMFYGLATHKLNTGDLKFEHLLKDIQTLNEEAMRGTYDVTAITNGENATNVLGQPNYTRSTAATTQNEAICAERFMGPQEQAGAARIACSAPAKISATA